MIIYEIRYDSSYWEQQAPLSMFDLFCSDENIRNSLLKFNQTLQFKPLSLDPAVWWFFAGFVLF